MQSGQTVLHMIDKALSQARSESATAAQVSSEVAAQIAELQRLKARAYDIIARERIELIRKDAVAVGDNTIKGLGAVDAKVARELELQARAERDMQDEVTTAQSGLEALERRRRAQEETVKSAVNAYDKAAAKAESALMKLPDYTAQAGRLEDAQATARRASGKLKAAQDTEADRGAPYRDDPFFTYLERRGYGTDHAKGWFLTRWLDGWVASLCNYKAAAQNYGKLKGIAQRLARHVETLEADILAQQSALEAVESKWLADQGVTQLLDTSKAEQSKLGDIDARIEQAEQSYGAVLARQKDLVSGETGPLFDARQILTQALSVQPYSELQRIAAQSVTLADDDAVADIMQLSNREVKLQTDLSDAQKILATVQNTMADVQSVRQRFKQRRYDAPASMFENVDLIQACLMQLLTGAISRGELWRRIERAQHTLQRYSDVDFGGVDWSEGLRLPRDTGGIAGPLPRSRRRTSLPRMPRQSLPRIPKIGGFGGFGGGGGGGFGTGGGF